MSFLMDGLKIGQQIFGFGAARRDAKAYNRWAAQKYAKDLAYTKALRAHNQRVYRSNTRQNLWRQVEEETASAFRQDDARRKSRGARATLQASMGERGIGGRLSTLLSGDIQRQQGDALAMAHLNLGAVLRQLQEQQNTLAPAPVADPMKPQFRRGPSFGSLLLGAGMTWAEGAQKRAEQIGKAGLG